MLGVLGGRVCYVGGLARCAMWEGVLGGRVCLYSCIGKSIALVRRIFMGERLLYH